jgi:hypothetical protein
MLPGVRLLFRTIENFGRRGFWALFFDDTSLLCARCGKRVFRKFGDDQRKKYIPVFRSDTWHTKVNGPCAWCGRQIVEVALRVDDRRTEEVMRARQNNPFEPTTLAARLRAEIEGRDERRSN